VFGPESSVSRFSRFSSHMKVLLRPLPILDAGGDGLSRRPPSGQPRPGPGDDEASEQLADSSVWQ
jgi:hypothetical protein